MTTAELLTFLSDETQPLATRYAAAQRLAYELKRELERACSPIFPDFYWSSCGDGCFHHNYDDPPAEVVLYLPQARYMSPDNELTQQRDRALRQLGFTHFGDVLLGLTTHDVHGCTAGDPT